MAVKKTKIIVEPVVEIIEHTEPTFECITKDHIKACINNVTFDVKSGTMIVLTETQYLRLKDKVEVV